MFNSRLHTEKGSFSGSCLVPNSSSSRQRTQLRVHAAALGPAAGMIDTPHSCPRSRKDTQATSVWRESSPQACRVCKSNVQRVVLVSKRASGGRATSHRVRPAFCVWRHLSDLHNDASACAGCFVVPLGQWRSERLSAHLVRRTSGRVDGSGESGQYVRVVHVSSSSGMGGSGSAASAHLSRADMHSTCPLAKKKNTTRERTLDARHDTTLMHTRAH